jgi:hypothetical protein
MSRKVLFSVGALVAAATVAQTPAFRKGVSAQAVTLRGTVLLEVTTVTPEQLFEKVRSSVTGQHLQAVCLKGTPVRRIQPRCWIAHCRGPCSQRKASAPGGLLIHRDLAAGGFPSESMANLAKTQMNS